MGENVQTCKRKFKSWNDMQKVTVAVKKIQTVTGRLRLTEKEIKQNSEGVGGLTSYKCPDWQIIGHALGIKA